MPGRDGFGLHAGGLIVGEQFFMDVKEPIRFGGLGSSESLAFKVYEPDRVVLGKRMEDHLRPGVCFWHSFAWAGTDMFGLGTFDRPWITRARWIRWPRPA